MKTTLSIKRDILKNLRKNRIVYNHCNSSGVIEFASISLNFNCPLGYVTAYVRDHTGFFGSISLEYLSFDKWFDKIVSYYPSFKRPNRFIKDIQYRPFPKLSSAKDRLENSLKMPIPSRLSHVLHG